MCQVKLVHQVNKSINLIIKRNIHFGCFNIYSFYLTNMIYVCLLTGPCPPVILQKMADYPCFYSMDMYD